MKKQGELFPHTPILIPNWDVPTQIKSVFTTKLYDPKANRTLAEYLPNIADLKIAIDPVRLDQTHSSIAHRINNKIQGLVGDALVTCSINLPCSIHVADCVPVFLCDETGTEISAIHAGWRGLLAGVIENTTKILTTPLSKVNAWIGPAISAEVYSVGEELRELFRLKDPSYLSFFEEIDNRIYFDLREAVKYTIVKVGISSIAQTSRCVYLEDKSFFSYRREKTRERMTGIIWISSER